MIMAEEYEVEIKGGEGEIPKEAPSSVTPEATPSEPKAPEGEQPKVETPAGETPAEIYELPDGRKVDAQTVLNEYKNLQKDYTQKSQKLATYEKKPDITNNEPVDFRNPEWTPKTYGELIELAKSEVFKDFENQRRGEEEQERQLATRIDAELGEVRKLDPKVNENKLFEHATKYNIPNLVSAYKNMKEMNDRIEAVRQETTKNLSKRASDPVAGTNGQEVPIDESQIFDPRASTRSLVDYLRDVKSKQ